MHDIEVMEENEKNTDGHEQIQVFRRKGRIIVCNWGALPLAIVKTTKGHSLYPSWIPSGDEI